MLCVHLPLCQPQRSIGNRHAQLSVLLRNSRAVRVIANPLRISAWSIRQLVCHAPSSLIITKKDGHPRYHSLCLSKPQVYDCLLHSLLHTDFPDTVYTQATSWSCGASLVGWLWIFPRSCGASATHCFAGHHNAKVELSQNFSLTTERLALGLHLLRLRTLAMRETALISTCLES